MRKPISIKIVGVIMLVVLLQGTALFLLFSGQLRDEFVAEKNRDIQTTMINLQETLHYLASKKEFEQIQQTVTSLGADIDINAALLLDDSNSVIASTRIDTIGKNMDVFLQAKIRNEIKQHAHDLKRNLKNVIWPSEDGQSLYAISPIVLGRLTDASLRPDKFGILFLHYDMGWIDRKNQEIFKKFFLPMMLMLLIAGLGLAIFFNVSISRRIKAVNNSASKFSGSDYGARIKITGNDEITDLALAFNVMAHEVQQQHKELLKREKNLAITLNSIGDAVITTDAEGHVTRMNPVAEKLTGWSFQEADGQPLKTIFPIVNASTREPIKNPVEKVFATGKTDFLISYTTLIAKDGTEYQIADSAAPIHNGDDHILGIVLVFNDVTEQYQLRKNTQLVQQTLQNKEKEQREILNSMVDAVITIDETGKVLSFNKTAEKLFGYRFDEIVGQNVNRLMPEHYAAKHDGYLQGYLESGEALETGLIREVEGQHKNKQNFPMRLSLAELPVDETGKRRFIGSCQDLSQIKQQEELLRRSQKMDALGKLTGGIAHDFNNMLGVVSGYADLLESMLEDQPKLANYAHEIHHAGERGAKLTKKLLSFSRKQSPEATKQDLNALLQEQQDMLQKTLTVSIKLLVDLADDVWPIWLDKNDLEDAIINMSINAMHAMNDKESGAQLTISTCNHSLNKLEALRLGLTAGDYVQLSLTDTGVGMDEMTKEKIFDPFFSTKGEKGTGLGLSQVFGFIKRAGGTIKVYSELGQGSKFVLYFPRYLDKDIDKATETREDVIDLSGKEKLLIVDDEAALRHLTSELLSQQGYQIFCAEMVIKH